MVRSEDGQTILSLYGRASSNPVHYFFFWEQVLAKKRAQVFALYGEKCVDAKLLRLVEKNVENSGEMRRR